MRVKSIKLKSNDYLEYLKNSFALIELFQDITVPDASYLNTTLQQGTGAVWLSQSCLPPHPVTTTKAAKVECFLVADLR